MNEVPSRSPMDYFEPWQPSAEAWRPLGAGHPFSPVNSTSAPVVLPSGAGAEVRLGRHEAAAVADDGTDALLHAGGAVWGLDWCHAAVASAAGRPCNYLAVGCHPAGAELHLLGRPAAGRNSIQVWEVTAPPGAPAPPAPASSPPEANGTAETAAEGPALPRLALVMGHYGGLTWHCRWCPAADAARSSAAPGALPRLGLLAAALGDGSVQVWSVPQPQSLAAAGGGAVVAAAPPVAVLAARHLSGSMPCVVDWLPQAPHDLLLVGCWDGTVAIARLQPGEGPPPATPGPRPVGLRLLAHFPADCQPLRAAKWLPAGAAGGRPTADLLHRSLFATAGHEGTVKVWDARDQFSPVYYQMLTSGAVLDLAWATAPAGVMAAMEDGSLRGLLLDAGFIAEQLGRLPGAKPPMMFLWRGRSVGALAAAAGHPRGTHVAFAGEDGVVGLAEVNLDWDNRRRRDHVPLGAVRVEAGAAALAVRTREELEAADRGGLFTKGQLGDRMEALRRVGGVTPDASQLVQRLAWGPAEGAAGEGPVWLATGISSGLVRVQWIQGVDL